jgi:mRNA interferase HicA
MRRTYALAGQRLTAVSFRPSSSRKSDTCVYFLLTTIDTRVYKEPMNSDQFRRYLAKQDCTFEPGKGSHLMVRRGDKMSILPQHGGKKQLGTGLMNKIKKDLGL